MKEKSDESKMSAMIFPRPKSKKIYNTTKKIINMTQEDYFNK
jgi:hypothetical protein